MAYKETISNVPDLLQEMSDNARLWIFQAEKPLNITEVELVQNHLDTFLVGWTSHNRALKASGIVVFDRFVIIALDESQSSQASGCSIDAMTHQIQAISASMSVNLLDRSTFYFLIENEIVGYPMNEVSSVYQDGLINARSLVFNNLIKNKGELTDKWIVPLEKSWHKRFV